MLVCNVIYPCVIPFSAFPKCLFITSGSVEYFHVDLIQQLNVYASISYLGSLIISAD